MESNILNPKIKANAVSAYLLLFVSLLFLFNKDNKYLNNSFVKSHTKTAFIIHLGFLITYIIFIYYGTGLNFQILDYSINNIISILLFLILFIFILIGIYKSNKGTTFSLSENLHTGKNINLSRVEKDGSKIRENDKLTLMLSNIPFLGFMTQSKYRENVVIKNSQKLNLIITFIIMSFYISGSYNLANLLFLVYTIFLVFLGINMFVNNNIIYYNLGKIPTIKQLYMYIISFTIYMKNYFRQKNFQNFNKIYINIKNNYKTQEDILEKNLQNKNDFKLINILVYIPIINFISIFNINSKLKIHIINGIIISLLFILSWLTLGFDNKQQLFLLFPIAFGIGNLKNLSYKLVFIYDIYNIIVIILTKITNIFGFLRKKHKEEKVFSAKI